MLSDFLQWKASQEPFTDDNNFFTEVYGIETCGQKSYFSSIVKDLVRMQNEIDSLTNQREQSCAFYMDLLRQVKELSDEEGK